MCLLLGYKKASGKLIDSHLVPLLNSLKGLNVANSQQLIILKTTKLVCILLVVVQIHTNI
jgi:hypothetical protein